MAEILRVLAATNLAAGVAVLVVLLLRRPARRLFGAGMAYALWLVVPLAALAVLLPPRVITVIAPRAEPPPVITVMDIAGGPSGPASAAILAPQDIGRLLVLAWCIGAAASLLFLAWNQGRFMRSLGKIRIEGRIGRAEALGVGPAVVGALFPRIVVPADFERRFSAAEQAAILAHEEAHLQAGHAGANGLMALIQCVFWFNPLIHVASFFLRIDQEMACDSAVLTRQPQLRRLYAEALLKTQLGGKPLPLGCYWPARNEHPLKARIIMLKRPLPGRGRRLSGNALAILLAGGGALGAWAALPAKVHVVQPDLVRRDTASAPAPGPYHSLATRTGQVLDIIGGWLGQDEPASHDPIPAVADIEDASATVASRLVPTEIETAYEPEPPAAAPPTRLAGGCVDLSDARYNYCDTMPDGLLAQGPMGESSITLLAADEPLSGLQARAPAKGAASPMVLRARNAIPANQAVDIQGVLRDSNGEGSAPLHMVFTPSVMKAVKDPGLSRLGVRSVGFGPQVGEGDVRLSSYVRTDGATYSPHPVNFRSGETRTIVLDDTHTLTVRVTIRPQTADEARADQEASAQPAARQMQTAGGPPPAPPHINVPGYLVVEPGAQVTSDKVQLASLSGRIDLNCKVNDARRLEDCAPQNQVPVDSGLADAAMTASFYLEATPDSARPSGATVKVPFSF